MELTGRVSRYSIQRGFGFISQDQEGDGLGDLFFHFRDVLTDMSFIQPGARVQYRVGERAGRRCAVLVEVLEDSDYANGN